MKNIIILSGLIFVFIGIFNLTQAQDSSNFEQNKTIEKLIDEKIEGEYIRIPKKDFEEIIEHRISNGIHDRFNILIGIIIGIGTILGFISAFLNKNTRTTTKELIEAQVVKFTNKAINEFQDYYKENAQNKLMDFEEKLKQNSLFFTEELTKSLKLIREENENKLILINGQIKNAENQIKQAEQLLINLEIQTLKEKFVDKALYDFPEDLTRTNNLLEKVEKSNLDYQIPVVVNLLSYIYYNDLSNKTNDLNKLIENYEKKYSLKSEAYVNAALKSIYDYNYYNSINQREKAIEYLDKSLELTLGYGQALGLKLQVFMMDYDRAENEKDKKIALDNTSNVLNSIIKSESPGPAYETIKRFKMDLPLESYGKYVKKIFQLFPEKMLELFEISNQYALRYNYEVFDINEFTA